MLKSHQRGDESKKSPSAIGLMRENPVVVEIIGAVRYGTANPENR